MSTDVEVGRWEDYVDTASSLTGFGGSQDISYVDARVHEKRSVTIVVNNGQLVAFNRSYEAGLGIRVFSRGITLYGSVSTPSKSMAEYVLDGLAKRLSNLRGWGRVDEYTLHDVPSEDVEYVVKEEKPFLDHIDDSISILTDLDKALRGLAGIELLSRHIVINYTLERKFFTSSDQVVVSSTIPRITFFAHFTGKDGEFVSKNVLLGASQGAEFLDYDYLLSQCRERIEAMERVVKEAKPIPIDKYNVIVGPEIAGIIAHEAVGHPFELDRILGMEGAQAGESYVSISDVEVRRIGSEAVTVMDDPTYPGAYGYYLYDDDGMRASARVMIREGVVKTLLSNRFVASRIGMRGNGSSRASSYHDEPLVRMGVTYFQEGEYSVDELIEEAGRGIFIKDYTEWNIDDRRINQRYTGFEAYLIQNGRLGPPVKYPVLESTTWELLSRVSAASSEIELFPGFCGKGDPMQVLPVSLGGPHLLINNILVGSR